MWCRWRIRNILARGSASSMIAVVLGMAEMARVMEAVEERLSAQGIADPAVQSVLTQLRTAMMPMR